MTKTIALSAATYAVLEKPAIRKATKEDKNARDSHFPQGSDNSVGNHPAISKARTPTYMRSGRNRKHQKAGEDLLSEYSRTRNTSGPTRLRLASYSPQHDLQEISNNRNFRPLDRRTKWNG